MTTNNDEETVRITSTLEIPRKQWETVSDLIDELDPGRQYGKKYKAEKTFELAEFLLDEWVQESLTDVSVIEAERRIQKIRDILGK